MKNQSYFAVLAVVSVVCGSAFGAPIKVTSPNAHAGDEFGFSVAGVGDLNEDGTPDVAVGAPSENSATQSGVGRAYNFSGKTGGPLLDTLTSPEPAAQGNFGFSLAPIADINNDDVPDVVVGAPGERVGGEELGRVHLYSGATGARVRSFNAFDEGVLLGRSFDYGAAVAVFGDANDDDVPDLVVGAPGWSILSSAIGGGFHTPGRAFLVDGLDGSRIEDYVAPNLEVDGSFGASLAVLSDINGDGLPEVAVGAPSDRSGQVLAGRVYVFNGATGAQLYGISSPNSINSGNFGGQVAAIEDLNGDTFADIVVTADNEKSGTLASTGRVYIFSGDTGNHLLTLNSPDAAAYMFFGNAMDVVADFNGDGLDDVVATVGTGTRLKQATGIPLRAFVMNSVTGAVLHRLTVVDSQGAPLFGSAAAGIGDIDTDGKEDIVLGSSFGQGGFLSRAFLMRSRDFAGSVTPPPSIECHAPTVGSATPQAIDIVALTIAVLFLGVVKPRYRSPS